MRDKASTAIITVVNGSISSKQIEGEFRHIVGAEVSKWNAKQVVANKFTLRFPTAKMVLDFSQFKLGMLNDEAQMIIESWASSLGAKGQLQMCLLFRTSPYSFLGKGLCIIFILNALQFYHKSYKNLLGEIPLTDSSIVLGQNRMAF